MHTRGATEHICSFVEKVVLLFVMIWELLKGGLFLLALEYWQVLLEYMGVKDGPERRF